MVPKKDGTKWTFNLRQGVISCDGNEFKADDVIYTWQRFKAAEEGSLPIGMFLASVGSVLTEAGELLDSEVRKIDDYTVRVVPRYPGAVVPLEADHILWQK